MQMTEDYLESLLRLLPRVSTGQPQRIKSMKKTKEKREPEVVLSDHDTFVCRRGMECSFKHPNGNIGLNTEEKGMKQPFSQSGRSVLVLPGYIVSNLWPHQKAHQVGHSINNTVISPTISTEFV